MGGINFEKKKRKEKKRNLHEHFMAKHNFSFEMVTT